MGFKEKRFVKPSKDSLDAPSQHLYFAGLGCQMKTDREQLREFLVARFGPLQSGEDDDGLYMPAERRYCIASFPDIEQAVRAHVFFAAEPDLSSLGASKVVARFAQLAEEKTSRAPEPECTSATEEVHVPGLLLVPDFVSAEEEAALLGELGGDSAPWRDSLNRRVQVMHRTVLY